MMTLRKLSKTWPNLTKFLRIIIVEKRIPGRILQIYYRFLGRFGKKVVIFKTKDGMIVKCFANSVTIFVEVLQKEDYSFPDFDFEEKVVIDIGANQGFFALYAAKRGAKVYAFEPCSENLRILRENVAKNGFQDRIRVVDCAVTGDKRQVELFVGVDQRGDILSGSVSTFNAERGGADVQQRGVRGIPINDIFSDFGIKRCDLLKFDCEGAEYEIFEHISDDSLSRISRIVGEVNQGRGAEIVVRLDSAGFDILHKGFEEAGLVKARRRSSTVPSKHQNA